MNNVSELQRRNKRNLHLTRTTRSTRARREFNTHVTSELYGGKINTGVRRKGKKIIERRNIREGFVCIHDRQNRKKVRNLLCHCGQRVRNSVRASYRELRKGVTGEQREWRDEQKMSSQYVDNIHLSAETVGRSQLAFDSRHSFCFFLSFSFSTLTRYIEIYFAQSKLPLSFLLCRSHALETAGKINARI